MPSEKLRDLLDASGKGQELKVRENPTLGVHVAGLLRRVVTSHEEIDQCIEDGTSNRTVASTKYNSESSRSHAVFELVSRRRSLLVSGHPDHLCGSCSFGTDHFSAHKVVQQKFESDEEEMQVTVSSAGGRYTVCLITLPVAFLLVVQGKDFAD